MLFNYEESQDTKKARNIINIMDSINDKVGKDTVFIAAQGIDRNWSMKRKMKSPNYTTNWNQLPVAYSH